MTVALPGDSVCPPGTTTPPDDTGVTVILFDPTLMTVGVGSGLGTCFCVVSEPGGEPLPCAGLDGVGCGGGGGGSTSVGDESTSLTLVGSNSLTFVVAAGVDFGVFRFCDVVDSLKMPPTEIVVLLLDVNSATGMWTDGWPETPPSTQSVSLGNWA